MSTEHHAANPSAPIRRALEFPTDITPLLPTPAFLEQAEGFGIGFDDGDLERLGTYLALLMRVNETMNLTAVRDAEEAWTRHIFDAISLLPLIEDALSVGFQGDRPTLADVGAGPGLPGIPLAVVMPELQVTCIESTSKKAAFIEHAAKLLKLENLTVVCDRAEDLGMMRGEHREVYDIVTARAVGRLAVIAELTVPLCRAPGLDGSTLVKDGLPTSGRILLIKGQKADEELEEAKQALHMLHAVHVGTVDTPTGRVIVLEKTRRIPKMYPRRAGEPKRAPLGVPIAKKHGNKPS